jgi:hypothetical protein
MKTAVQLRPIAVANLPRCDLVQGAPLTVLAGGLGGVALFAAGDLVAYRLRGTRLHRLYVFRTLDVADPLATSLPGVRPRVRLLPELHSAGRVRLARTLFAYLTRTGCEPSLLADAFYLRVGVVLAGRLPARKILLSILGREELAPFDADGWRTAQPSAGGDDWRLDSDRHPSMRATQHERQA